MELNKELLYKKIDQSGQSLISISKKMGITREALYHKLRGNSEFKASEIAKITEVLSLTKRERDSIFFA